MNEDEILKRIQSQINILKNDDEDLEDNFS